MGLMSKKIKLEKQQLRAGFVPESFDVEKNTVDVVWSTGSRVKRYSYFSGEYVEELSMKKAHVRLDRLNKGAPILNNHNRYSLEDVIGVVESAKIEDGKGVATIRLSKRPEIQGIVNDIRDGILRNLSVGYAVHKFQELKEKDGETPIYRAVDWEPLEISFVGIPADADSQVRKQPMAESTECEIENEYNEGDPMKQKTRSGENEPVVEDVPAPAPEVPAVDPAPAPEETETPATEPVVEEPAVEPAPAQTEAERALVVEIEMVRQKDIRTLVRKFGFDENFADKLVENKSTIVQARALVLDELEKKTSFETRNIRIGVQDMDTKELRNKAMVRGMLNAYNSEKFKMEDGDQEFRFSSIQRAARQFLQANGVGNVLALTNQEVAQRVLHTSSDFPEILANVANKSMLGGYEAAPRTFGPFVRQRNASDFKELSSLALSTGEKLEKVNEHGEYKKGTLKETAEKYKIEKYGKIIGVTYELLVNDDMNAFTELAVKMGQRAREKENEVFWSLFLSNPTLSETAQGLISVAHKNLAAAGSAISIAAIGAGRASMRLMKDLDGEPINLAPSYLVVPPSLETVADQFVSSITPNVSGSVNPFANRLQVISEPRIEPLSGAMPWYLFAGSSMVDMAEIAYLDGKGPEISTREGFTIDGMETKIRHHFAIKFVNYRGFYKNPGV